MLLPTPDLSCQSGLPASQIHRFLQRIQSIHAGIYTTLVVISQQPGVFADQQLSCYVRRMAIKTQKPKRFQNWQETQAFPDRVTWAREERGWKQDALAARVGCSQQNIAKAEKKGAKGSGYTVQIAAELSVNALWLATGKGEPELNLKDLTSDDLNLAMALAYLPTDTKNPLLGGFLATALPFVPATHPRYKAIEEIYIKTMDSAVKEAIQKTGSSGKRPPIKPPVEVVLANGELPEKSAGDAKRSITAANDAPIRKKVAARTKRYRVSRPKK